MEFVARRLARRPPPGTNARRRPVVDLTIAVMIAAVVVPGPPLGPVRAAAAPSDVALVVRAAEEQRAEGGWMWPVTPPILMIAPFLAPPTPYSAGHRGIDIAVKPGDGVVAPAAGIVTFAGPVAGRDVVAIDHGGGLVSAIEPVSAAVAPGATVRAGDPLGVVATGGHCEARCAHFGVRLHGAYVSPLLFLGGVPRAVLLPLG